MTSAYEWDLEDDDWGDEDDMCDHDDYDIDILDGRKRCYRCGESWFMTDEELDHHEEMQRAADAYYARLESPWYRFKEWMASLFSRRSVEEIDDDEIPF